MIELTIQRGATGGIDVQLCMQGTTDELLGELAAGAAHAVMMIADDLPACDRLHESLGREIGAEIERLIGAELAQRDKDYVDGIGDA